MSTAVSTAQGNKTVKSTVLKTFTIILLLYSYNFIGTISKKKKIILETPCIHIYMYEMFMQRRCLDVVAYDGETTQSIKTTN